MISVHELSKSYSRKNKVLKDVSFDLPDTGFVCIIGPSGCGKTTLLNALGGLDTFDHGRISTDHVKHFRCGTLLSEKYRNRNFGYIFQNYYLLPDHSVAYNVYLGLHAMPLSHKEKLRRVKEALASVDMSRYARRLAGELSGGQQQRVAIARALARRPRVIFADEPTGNLDQTNTVNICTLLRNISRTSLVVMVTHEESIARFFADRILSIEDGRLTTDESDWARDGLSVDGSSFYAGDYAEAKHQAPGVSLRFLREDGASDVKITVLALKDRIVVKLDDGRNLVCSKEGDFPTIQEGTRPVLCLEEIEHTATPDDKPQIEGRAGRGIRFSMLAKEANRLSKGRSAKRAGINFFLVVLTLLTLLTFADYQYVAHVDPEDFVTTHSQLLEIRLSRGPNLSEHTWGVSELADDYVDYLKKSGENFTPLPVINISAECHLGLFRQFDSVTEKLRDFTYVPLEYLDEATLIYGRMPKNAHEIVVDRWVLDNLLEENGMLQTGISNCNYFLDKQLFYSRKDYCPTIVGICDSGEPALYMDLAGIASVAPASTEVICLSDFKALCPAQAVGISLNENECIVISNNAGAGYVGSEGYFFKTNSDQMYQIAAVVEADTYAKIVINDNALDALVRSLLSEYLYIICDNKEAVKDFLQKDAGSALNGKVQINVLDDYTAAWEEKVGQTQLRLNARTIVTATILLLSFIMLYLFQRAQVREQIGMVAVYRLLGIPGRKLGTIFCIRSILVFLRTTFPVTLLVWIVLTVLGKFKALEIPLYLSLKAAAIGAGAILIFHILVSLIPLYCLLRQPPARLASKFDI